MAFIGEKSTGWSGPRGDFIQELQESLLRVKLMADWTMNSRLTTAACPPRDIPISCVSAERYQSAIKKRTEGGKVKERKKGAGEGNKDTETLRSWRKNASIHLQRWKQWNTSAPSKCATPPPCPSGGASHSQETDHTHKQFIIVCDVRRELIFVRFPPTQKKMKSNLYSWSTNVNSTVIKFSEMTLCWLSDAVSVSLAMAHAHDTPRHNDRHAQAAWRHLICCLTYNLDLNLFLCLLELKSEMESWKQKGRWKWHAAKFSRPISDS